MMMSRTQLLQFRKDFAPAEAVVVVRFAEKNAGNGITNAKLLQDTKVDTEATANRAVAVDTEVAKEEVTKVDKVATNKVNLEESLVINLTNFFLVSWRWRIPRWSRRRRLSSTTTTRWPRPRRMVIISISPNRSLLTRKKISLKNFSSCLSKFEDVKHSIGKTDCHLTKARAVSICISQRTALDRTFLLIIFTLSPVLIIIIRASLIPKTDSSGWRFFRTKKNPFFTNQVI